MKQTHRTQPKIKTAFRKITTVIQVMATMASRKIITASGGYTLQSDVDFDPKKRYLFVSNHQSRWDPFAIFGLLGAHDTATVSPIKFLTAKSIFRTPLMPVLALLGCYPTSDRERTVNKSVQLLRDNYSVLIFPEGRRTTRLASDPRPGVIRIIEKSTDDTSPLIIILCHIQWKRYSYFNRHVDLRISESKVSQYNDAYELMRAIYKV